MRAQPPKRGVLGAGSIRIRGVLGMSTREKGEFRTDLVKREGVMN